MSKEDFKNCGRVIEAIHLFLRTAVTCVSDSIDLWHRRIKGNISPCSSRHQCSTNGPCANCVALGEALEQAVFFPPGYDGIVVWPHDKTTLWGATTHVVDIAKVLAVHSLLTDVKEMAHFDADSLLKIMMRFKDFHHGHTACYALLERVQEINHECMKRTVDKTSHSKLKKYLTDLVGILKRIHPLHFTSEITTGLCNGILEILQDTEFETYMPIHEALYEIEHHAVPCISEVVMEWHKNIRMRLQPCSFPSKCLSNCKPDKNTEHCKNCIEWAHVIEALFNAADNEESLHWKNIKCSDLHSNPLEAVKAYMPVQTSETGISTLHDLDTTSVLFFMMRFKPFHKGSKELPAAIQKVYDIMLHYLKVDGSSYLDESQITSDFKDIKNLINFLQMLHPKFFTDQKTADLTSRLKEIRHFRMKDYTVDSRKLKFVEFAVKGRFSVWRSKLIELSGQEIPVAVKRITSIDKDSLCLMKKLNHTNLIEFIGVSADERATYIVLEFASQGDLRKYLNSSEDLLSLNCATRWVKEACNAVQYLHGEGCVHPSIKSSTFLVTGNCPYVLKLCSFGLVKDWDQTKSTRAAKELSATCYMAPEIVTKQLRSRKSDIFALAIVLWEIITGQEPYAGLKGEFRVMTAVVGGKRPLIPDDCPKLALLMASCWQEDYKSRPNVVDIIPHLDTVIQEYYDTQSQSMKAKRTKTHNAVEESAFCEGETMTSLHDQPQGGHVYIDVQYLEKKHAPMPGLINTFMAILANRNSCAGGVIHLVNKKRKKDGSFTDFDGELCTLFKDVQQAKNYEIHGSYEDEVRHITLKPVQQNMILAYPCIYKWSGNESKVIFHTENLVEIAFRTKAIKLPTLPKEYAYMQSYPDTEGESVKFVDTSNRDMTSFLDDVNKHASAFANTHGGRILFGIANDGIIHGVEPTESRQQLISRVDDYINKLFWFQYRCGRIEPEQNTHWAVEFINIVGALQGSKSCVIALTIKPVVGVLVYATEPLCPVWDLSAQEGYRIMTFQEWCEYLQTVHEEKFGKKEEAAGTLETDCAIARPAAVRGQSPSLLVESSHSRRLQTSYANSNTPDSMMQITSISPQPQRTAKIKYQERIIKVTKEVPLDVKICFTNPPKTEGLRFASSENAGALPETSKIKARQTNLGRREDPVIRVLNYTGPIQITAFLTTEEGPAYIHPNRLVGGCCQSGVFSQKHRLVTPGEPIGLSSMHIVGVKRQNIGTELEQRKAKLTQLCPRTDIQTTKSAEYDLSRAQLCIVGYLPDDENTNLFNIPLQPITSICLSDKGYISSKEPRILQISESKGPVSGGQEVILVVARIKPDDYTVVFSVNTTSPPSSWQLLATVTESHVQKSTLAVTIKTPSFYDKKITFPVTVKVQVRRSDGAYSNTLLYAYLPDKDDSVSIKKKVDTRRPMFVGHFCCIGAASLNVLEWNENEYKMRYPKKMIPYRKPLTHQEMAESENLRSVIERLPQMTRPVERPGKSSKATGQTRQRPADVAGGATPNQSSDQFRKYKAFAVTHGYNKTVKRIEDVKANFNVTNDKAGEVTDEKNLLPQSGEDKKDKYISDWVSSTVSAVHDGNEDAVPEDGSQRCLQEAEMKAIAEGTVQPKANSSLSNHAGSHSGSGSFAVDLAADYQKHLDEGRRSSSSGTYSVDNSGDEDDDVDGDDDKSNAQTTNETGLGSKLQTTTEVEVDCTEIVDHSDCTQSEQQRPAGFFLDDQAIDWLEILGKGKFGLAVFLVKLQDNTRAVAKMTNNPDAENMISILKSLDHQHIMSVYGLVHRNNVMYIVLEYMQYGSLQKFLKDGTLSGSKVALSLVLQAAQGIKYLHKNKRVHGDIGSHNCFLLSNDELKVRILDLDDTKFVDDDVRMYGDLLCEVLLTQYTQEDTACSGGATPRPDIPNHCPLKLRQLILACWREGPYKLQTMTDVLDKLNPLVIELKSKDNWTNLDESIEDNLNQDIDIYSTNDVSIPREDSGCMTSSVFASGRPQSQNPMIAAFDVVMESGNSIDDSGTFLPVSPNYQSPNTTQTPSDLNILSVYSSRKDSTIIQQTNAKVLEENLIQNATAEEQSHHSNQALDDNLSSHASFYNNSASSPQRKQKHNSIVKNKRQVGALVVDCEQQTTRQQTDHIHSLDTNLIQRSDSSKNISHKSLLEEKKILCKSLANTNEDNNIVSDSISIRNVAKATPPAVTKVVDSSGDILYLEQPDVSLTIPPGAVQEPTEITLTMVWDDENLPRLEEKESNVCPIVRCLPNGLQFDKAVTIKIPHCAVPIGNKELTTQVYFNQKDEDEPADWQKTTGLTDCYPKTKVQGDYLLLNVTHFTDFFVTIEDIEMKRMKIVAYVSKTCEQMDQVIHVYVHNDNPSAYQRVVEEQNALGDRLRTGLSPTYFVMRSCKDITAELILKSVGWLLLSDDRKILDLFNVWHDDITSCQFTLKVIKPVERLFCKIKSWQEDNPRRAAEIEITKQEASTTRPTSTTHEAPHTPNKLVMTYRQQQSAEISKIGAECQSTQSYHSHKEMVMAVDPYQQQLNTFDSGNISTVSWQTVPTPDYQSNRPSFREPLLPYQLKLIVCSMLDVELLMGNDYRILADKFKLDYWRFKRESSPSDALLDQLETQIVSREELIKVLKHIDRHDVVQEITKYFNQLPDSSCTSFTEIPALENRPGGNYPLISRDQLSVDVNPHVKPTQGFNLHRPGRPQQVSSPPVPSIPSQMPDTPGGSPARVPEEPAGSPLTNPFQGRKLKNPDNHRLSNEDESRITSSIGPTNVQPADDTDTIGELRVGIDDNQNTIHTIHDSAVVGDDNGN